MFIALASDTARSTAFAILRTLQQRVPAQMEQGGRSMKGQMKQADRVGATHVVIVGDSLEVKEMASGEQRQVASIADAVGAVAG